jgi:hypothetical protein
MGEKNTERNAGHISVLELERFMNLNAFFRSFGGLCVTSPTTSRTILMLLLSRNVSGFHFSHHLPPSIHMRTFRHFITRAFLSSSAGFVPPCFTLRAHFFRTQQNWETFCSRIE